MATLLNIENIRYDINQSYGLTSHEPSFNNEIDAIEQSISNILLTPIGTRLRNRQFGTSLYKYLYKFQSVSRAEDIINEIINAITTYEPRVQVIPSDTNIKIKYKKREYEIELSYLVVKSSELRVYRFALENQV